MTEPAPALGADTQDEAPYYDVTLHKAVFQGDLETVQKCVQYGVDVNCRIGNAVPLTLAIGLKQTEIALYLVEQGADVNRGGRNGKLPLYIAAKIGNLQLVTVLLAAGADMEMPFITGNTPMLAAASEGHIEVVRVLLAAGSNAHCKNNAGHTGLHMGAYQRNTTLIKIFLDAGLDGNLFTHGRGTNRQLGSTPLHFAAMSPEQDETGRSAVTECRETLRLLLDAGADVNATQPNGRTALHLAAASNCTTIAEILINNGAQIDPISSENNEHKTPLHHAVDAGHVAMVTTLINAGADVTSCDIHGVIPLFTAVFSNNQPITELLLRAGSDVNASTNNKTTPFVASLRHPPIITQMLLLAGCQGNLDDFLQLSLKYTGDEERRAREWVISFLQNPRTVQQRCREVVRCVLIERKHQRIHDTLQESLTKLGSEETNQKYPSETVTPWERENSMHQMITSLPVPPKLHSFLMLDDLRSTVK